MFFVLKFVALYINFLSLNVVVAIAIVKKILINLVKKNDDHHLYFQNPFEIIKYYLNEIYYNLFIFRCY